MATKMLTLTQQAKMEPIIIEKLIHAKGKNAIKEIANELKVDQSYVRSIYSTHNIGQKRKLLEEQSQKSKNVADVVHITSPVMITQSTVDVGKMFPSQELICNMSVEEKKQDIQPTLPDIVQKRKGGRPGISDDIKLAVVLDYENDENSTYNSLADKYNISVSSITRIIKEIGGENVAKKRKSVAKRSPGSRSRSINNHQRRKSIKELEKEYVKNATGNSKLVREEQENISVENNNSAHKSNRCIVNHANQISEPVKTILSTCYQLNEIKEVATKVGLCSDRHEMNVDTFMYGILTEEEMFDYPKLYNKAIEFIEKLPSKVLHLYCTGIQCALAAVIKACHDKKVTLSLFHYNAHVGTYMRQDMWKYSENFIDETVASFADIMRKGPVYTFGGKIDPEEFYTISINQVKDRSDGFISQAYVVCDTIENAFKLYLDYVKDINKNRDVVKKAVFLTKCKIEKGKFLWDVNLSKSYNFK